TPVTWIHEHVAGLRRGPEGWGQFLVAPDPAIPVGRIAMTRTTDQGEIALEVDRESRTLALTVPDGARARVELPGLTEDLSPGNHRLSWCRPRPRAVAAPLRGSPAARGFRAARSP